MLSPLTYHDRQLALHRYPVNQQNRSLQAWDAADEYLFNYLHEQQLLDSPKQVSILNDGFGALTTALSDHRLTVVSDSKVSHLGIAHNLKVNSLSDENISLIDSLTQLTISPDIVLLKIPKSKSLLVHQLIQLQTSCREQTLIIAAARAKDIHKSTLALFEKYLGATTTSLAVKKARLVFCQRDCKLVNKSPFPTTWQLESRGYEISNQANVFSRESLDIGARFFMQHLPALKSGQTAIDLGCGNGVIGLSLLADNPECKIRFIDESYMAVASARENVERNLPSQQHQCQFLWQDCIGTKLNEPVDLVLCNPPFHQQHAVTDHIAWQMFKESHQALKKGGELRIIGNRQLGYHVKLKRLFGNCQTIASNKKFVILSAKK